MTWSINTIVPLLALLLYSGLFLVVTFSRPQTESRRTFRWYLLGMVFWSLSAFLVLADPGRAVIWFRVMISSTLATMVSIFFFAHTVTERRITWEYLVPFFSGVLIIFSLTTDWVVKMVSVQQGAVNYQFGPLIVLVALPGYLFMVYSLTLLIRAYRKAPDAFQKNRLVYLIAGIGLMIGASGFNFTPLGQYPVDIAANALTALLIAYAILRYQLLDISLVIRKGLLYSIPTVIISTTYFLIITLSLRLFNLYTGLEIFLLSLSVAIITALIAEPLRKRAQAVIDRLFFREKYDSRLMLQNLSNRATNVLDLDQVTEMILDEVSSTLHIEKAGILLKEEHSDNYVLISQVGLPEDLSIEMRPNHPMVLWLSSHDQLLTENDIEVLPLFRSMWKQERNDLEALDGRLYIPLRVQDELVGIFTLGQKRSEELYDQDERLTLSTLANQTSVAIENARLYTAEQNRRKEMDTLYSMARELVKTDELKDILHSIARHAVESTHVDYARILLEQEGNFVCEAVHHPGAKDLDLGSNRLEPLVAEHFYQWILLQGQTLILDWNSPHLKQQEREAIFVQPSAHLCLSPLSSSNDHIGVLVLGVLPGEGAEPFTPSRIRLINMISDHAINAIQRAALHKQLEENFLQTVVSLANAMDARDSYTGDHSQRMVDLSTALSFEMSLDKDQIEAVHWAALLHDIGKIGVPDEILNKAGPLTDQEWNIMKQHPEMGSEILGPVNMLSDVAPIIRAHHERFDGGGYPYGLRGEQIPIESRIISVVDAYIAIRDDRVYNNPNTHEEAIAEIRRNSGSQFDPEVVDTFCRLFS